MQQNAPTQPVIELKQINMLYLGKERSTDALQDIDLTISKGDFVCVLGPSGCGKSTLLNIIAGLLRPTSGTACMMGEPITGADWHRAVIFQTPTLYPWLNTRENVAFGPKMRGLPAAEIAERTEKYLELVGLSEFAESRPYELSGGMKQRAALARVLVNEPYMILMDEPFGALDALTRANMQALIRRIWQEQHNTVFLITHDVDEALSLATRVLVMSSRPGRIVTEYATDFSARTDVNAFDDIKYLPEYIALRKDILAKINI